MLFNNYMKVQIRKNVFETNSSSTHSLVICSKDLYDKFINNAVKAFTEKYGHSPKVYNVTISDGARRIC